VDVKFTDNWSRICVSHDRARATSLKVSGRVVHITDDPTNAVFNLQAFCPANDQTICSAITTCLQVIGVAGCRRHRLQRHRPQPDGSVANNGIAGQGDVRCGGAGGLVRANSATNGHGQPYNPHADLPTR
jgi:hypothetical protein